jgi:CRISPR-associated protein Cmr3
LFTLDSADEVESIEDAVITGSSLKRYLRGNENKTIIKKLSDTVNFEPKVGIGRDNNTHTTDESKLYRVGMRRLSEKKEFGKDINTLSLVVEIEGLNIKSNGIMKLGAEGKAAVYSEVSKNADFFSEEELKEINSNSFKLYLTSPAFFELGSNPDFKNNTLLKGLDLELSEMCVGKPISIGGFDMKKGCPKPMRKAVPSGSVYYLKSKSKTFNEIYKQLNGKSISEFLPNEGYGIAYVGVI